MEDPLLNEWVDPRHVDTEGHCFFCLIKLEPESKSSFSLNWRHPFQYLCGYLKVDFHKVYNDGEEEHLLSWNGDSASKLITVSLCKGCASISDKFSELYKQLERIRMELISYLGVIQGKMTSAEESGLAELFRKSKGRSRKGGRGSNSKPRDNLRIVEELRRETMEKCSHKLRIFLPTVHVQQLTPEEQNAQMDATINPDPSIIKSRLDVDFERDLLTDPDYLPEEDNHSNLDLDFIDEPSQPNLPPATEFKNEIEAGDHISSMPTILFRPRRKTDCKKMPVVTGNSRLNSKTGKRKCNHCPREFLCASAFLSHYNERHLKLRHECGLCREDFVSRGNLSRHHKKEHMGIRYSCDTCNKIFSFKSSLRYHQRLNNCNLEGKGYRKPKPPKAKKAQENMKGESQDADLQTSASDDDEEKVNKKRKHRRRPVEVIVDADGIKKSHKKTRPPNPTIVLEINGTPHSSLDSEAKCSICSKEFKNHQLLHDHSKSDHPNYFQEQRLKLSFDCPVCRKQFAQRGNYLRHHRSTHVGVRYACESCKRLFSFKANLRKHQGLNNCSAKGRGYRKATPKQKVAVANKTTMESSDTEDDPESPPSPLPEGVIVEKVKKKKKYQRQPVEIVVGAGGVKQSAPILPPNIIQEEMGTPQSGINAETGKHECGICPSQFKELNVLHDHFHAIHLKRRFQCQICEKQFSYRQVYNQHYHKVHIAASYRCHGCKELFNRKSKLKEHQKESSCGSTANYKFKCHECGKEFARSIQLKRHVDSVHLKLKEHICDQCGRGFDSNGHLKKHQMTVHSMKFDDKGPLECEYCKKQFPIIDYLRLHLRVHTGEKPYVCEQCGKTFAARSNWNRHREMHDQVGHHQCPQCNRLFPDQPKLTEHQERTGHGLIISSLT